MSSDELRWAQQDPRERDGHGRRAAASAAARTDGGILAIYYPGVADIAGATKITLATGEERAGLDFQLQTVRPHASKACLIDPDADPRSRPSSH